MHGPKPLVAAAVLASGASAVVNEYVSIGAGIATICGCGLAFATWLRGRRRRRSYAPQMPDKLPLERTSKADYQKALAEWELFRARNEQFEKDRKGQHD